MTDLFLVLNPALLACYNDIADNLNFVMLQTKAVSNYNIFLPSGIQLWNGLPLDTKCIDLFTLKRY